MGRAPVCVFYFLQSGWIVNPLLSEVNRTNRFPKGNDCCGLMAGDSMTCAPGFIPQRIFNPTQSGYCQGEEYDAHDAYESSNGVCDTSCADYTCCATHTGGTEAVQSTIWLRSLLNCHMNNLLQCAWSFTIKLFSRL